MYVRSTPTGKSVETNHSLQQAMTQLSQTTDDAISRMNSGADTLYIAASDFAKAGQGVAETMGASSEALGHIKSAAQTLDTAASATRDVLLDYSKTRDSFTAMVSEFKAIVENAKRETAMSSEVIAGLEAAAAQLSTAQKHSEEYLKGINEVLVKVHESFAENVERTLREGNRQFQKELRDAVNLVSAAVKELGDTLDDLPARANA